MRLLSTIVIVFLSVGVFAQQPNAKANLRQAAINLGNSLISKNYAGFMETTYPTVIQKTEGGVDKMIADLKKQVELMERSGNTINAMWPGQPSEMVDTAGELQCTIPQFMKLKLPNGTLTTETTLVAISPNNGQTWYFIDAVDQSNESMRKLFPNLSSKLVLKPSPEPKFEAFKK
jgi:hypothetical protein